MQVPSHTDRLLDNRETQLTRLLIFLTYKVGSWFMKWVHHEYVYYEFFNCSIVSVTKHKKYNYTSFTHTCSEIVFVDLEFKCAFFCSMYNKQTHDWTKRFDSDLFSLHVWDFFLTSNKKTISHVSVGRIYHLNISVRPAGNQCAKVELGILFLSVRIQLVRSGLMLKALDSSSSLCNLFLICFWGKVFVCLFFLLSI